MTHTSRSVADALAFLGLPARGATRGDLVRVYRRLAAAAHPDTGGSATAFRALTAARELLEPLLPPGPPRHIPRSPVARPQATITVSTPTRLVPGPLREARGTAAPSTTSYPQETGDFVPWDGAAWTGADSGLAWVPNPREYACPRRHGATYRARGRR